MNKKIVTILFFAFLFVYSCNLIGGANYGDTLTVGEWNVENLFDTIDDPGKKDEEFTPNSNKHWTLARLHEKLNHLAKVLNLVKPDLWGFEEVEHKALIDSIVSRLNYAEYGIVYAESPDFRGIDNALIYRKDKFAVISFDTLKVALPLNHTTRYILYAKLRDYNGNVWNVFVNHWPSRWGGKEKSEPKRISAAQTLREYLICNKINKNVIIMGDFNDDPTDPSIRYVLSAKTDKEHVIRKKDLINLAAPKFLHGEGSLEYHGKWNMLDQIIVTQDLLGEGKIRYVKNSFNVIKYDFMVVQSGKYKGYPARTYAGRKFLGGYSDHFPVTAKFVSED